MPEFVAMPYSLPRAVPPPLRNGQLVSGASDLCGPAGRGTVRFPWEIALKRSFNVPKGNALPKGPLYYLWGAELDACSLTL